MADQDTSLPVRTEAAGDVDIFISDSTTPTQKLLVNADGSLDVNTTIPAGEKIIVTDGTDDLEVNGDGSINAVVTATDLDIRDLDASQDNLAISDGTDTLAINTDGSINVKVDSDVAGDEIVDYQTTAALAKNVTTNHDYTVTAAKTFIAERAWVSGSGKLKVELLVNGATKYVGFNSTANPNIDIPLDRILKGNATEVIRMTIENRDNQAADVYSTLSGVEV